ncbi:MAG: FecR domain-containing protein [Oligoflexia bacterium]|nr:FecR domain-containing protein [Oligoflexia bacterium]MBF0365732.1 FecR domain-containing protein [Oligoflexia bacterium]
MRLLLLLVGLFYFNVGMSAEAMSENGSAEDLGGEFKFDPKTSTAMPNHIGEVLSLKGRVVNAADVLLLETQKIMPGDVFKTSKKGGIKVRMVDDSIIALGENSMFEFANFEFKNKSERKAKYLLHRGEMRLLVKNKSKSANDIFVKMGAISFGVKGTEVLANVFDGPKGEQVKQVALLSGNIELNNQINGKAHMLASGDQFVSVSDAHENKESLNKLDKEVLAMFLKNDAERSAMQDLAFLEHYKVEITGGATEARAPASITGSDEAASTSVLTSTADDHGDASTTLQKEKGWKENLSELNGRLKVNNR